VNRRAGVPFDRIVAALTVNPKGEETVSVYPSIQTTVEIRRSRLLAVVGVAAALAAVITWVLVAYAFDTTSSKATTQVVPSSLPSAEQDARRVPSIMTLTPARLAGGALGTGYALPTKQSGPTVASVLASMDPQTRRYTRAIMNLTFAQLGAGAAGQP
jgi:hypothetical protein